MERLLEESQTRLDYRDSSGWAAVHIASWTGSPGCVSALTSHPDTDWNLQTEWGGCPLYLALLRGHKDVVELLSGIPGLDYDLTTDTEVTLAEVAVRHGGPDCVRHLVKLETFRCWNVEDRQGDTPLLWALKNDQLETVKLLLACPRVDHTVKDSSGATFMKIARSSLVIDALSLASNRKF